MEIKAVCRNCHTFLKIEETDTTIASIVIEESVFLTLENLPIAVNDNGSNDLEFYKDELEKLEIEWSAKKEDYKIKNGKNRILPRRQSILFLVGAALLSIYALITIFYYNDPNFFLIITGPIWIISNIREFTLYRKWKEAEEEYLDERNRIENEIQYLKSF